jgi:hypothetical protein
VKAICSHDGNLNYEVTIDISNVGLLESAIDL